MNSKKKKTESNVLGKKRPPQPKKKVPSEKQIRALIKRNGRINGFFPVGVSASFVFDLREQTIVFVEASIYEVVGMPREKILKTPAYELFTLTIADDQVPAARQMMSFAVHYMSMRTKEQVVVNMEYNILDPSGECKRILLQVSPLTRSKADEPILLHGYVTDITPILPDGAPRLTVLVGKRVELSVQSWPEGASTDPRFRLTHRELTVLVLKRQGLRAKEIAHSLHLREMTVYSITRDIKKKTGMDILPLIRLLEQNGTISR